ncbi:MAG: RNA 2',3'-cyclic phosphodiesterase [Actinomycetota bacterium]
MRLFVAVEIPERQKRSVDKSIQSLRMALLGAVRWVPRENWHATVKFLGEVPDARLPEVLALTRRVAASAAPATTALTGVGAFPSLGRARVLWVGLSDDAGRLAALASALEEALGGAGFRRESRPLHLHLTLARLGGQVPIGRVVEEAGPFAFDREPFAVASVTLYRSRLARTGSVYEVVEEFPLGGSPT